MFAQMMESFRKASESSFQAGQDLLKQWGQAGALPVNLEGTPAQWTEGVQKRWSEFTLQALAKQRELLDATYKSSGQVLEQSLKVGDAKSFEDHRRLVENLWRQLADSMKVQYEAQYREFQAAMTKWLEVARRGAAPEGSSPQAGTAK
jgi:hypothetical protein